MYTQEDVHEHTYTELERACWACAESHLQAIINYAYPAWSQVHAHCACTQHARHMTGLDVRPHYR